MASEEILLAAAARGGDRQTLHETPARALARGRRAASRTAARRNPLLELVAADPAFGLDRAAARRRCWTAARFVGRAPEQVDEFLAEVVEPWLAVPPGRAGRTRSRRFERPGLGVRGAGLGDARDRGRRSRPWRSLRARARRGAGAATSASGPAGATTAHGAPAAAAAGGDVEEGLASWYGEPYHGRPTASGPRYDMWAMTAAHRTLPFGTRGPGDATSTTAAQADVMINDRGPFVAGRILDLSRARRRGARRDRPGRRPGPARGGHASGDGMPDEPCWEVQVGAFAQARRTPPAPAANLEGKGLSVRFAPAGGGLTRVRATGLARPAQGARPRGGRSLAASTPARSRSRAGAAGEAAAPRRRSRSLLRRRRRRRGPGAAAGQRRHACRRRSPASGSSASATTPRARARSASGATGSGSTSRAPWERQGWPGVQRPRLVPRSRSWCSSDLAGDELGLDLGRDRRRRRGVPQRPPDRRDRLVPAALRQGHAGPPLLPDPARRRPARPAQRAGDPRVQRLPLRRAARPAARLDRYQTVLAPEVLRDVEAYSIATLLLTLAAIHLAAVPRTARPPRPLGVRRRR